MTFQLTLSVLSFNPVTPVLVVADKEVYPDVAGHPHNYRHKNNKRGNNGYECGFQAAFKEEERDNKSSKSKGYTYTVAYIHSPKKE